MASGRPRDHRPSHSRNLAEIYNYYLLKNPLMTKCCTSAVTSALGDIIAQLSSKQSSYEYRRTIAFALFGFFGTGPLTHVFYNYLAVAIKAQEKYAKIFKLIIERLVFAPAFLMLFFYSIPLLEGKGIAASHNKVKAAYWSALKANWKVWTLFQYININYVPQQYQTLFANAIALFWNIYLSAKQA